MMPRPVAVWTGASTRPQPEGGGPLKNDLPSHAEGAVYMPNWAPNVPAVIAEKIDNPRLKIPVKITGIEGK